MQLEAKLKLKRASSGGHLSLVMKKEGGGCTYNRSFQKFMLCHAEIEIECLSKLKLHIIATDHIASNY